MTSRPVPDLRPARLPKEDGSSEHAYDGPPISTHDSARCPRCGVGAVYVDRTRYLRVDDAHAVFAIRCSRCREATVVVERGGWGQIGSDQFFRSSGIAEIRWPPANAAVLIDKDAKVPPKAMDAYAEGLRCLSVDAPNAAAGRFRTALAVIANQQGGNDVVGARQLSTKLQKLFDLRPDLGPFEPYTKVIKKIGDDGVHQEDRDDSVTTEEALFVGELVRHLIRVLYEIPALIQRTMPTPPAVP